MFDPEASLLWMAENQGFLKLPSCKYFSELMLILILALIIITSC